MVAVNIGILISMHIVVIYCLYFLTLQYNIMIAVKIIMVICLGVQEGGQKGDSLS
jgi:hypothetical protein